MRASAVGSAKALAGFDPAVSSFLSISRSPLYRRHPPLPLDPASLVPNHILPPALPSSEPAPPRQGTCPHSTCPCCLHLFSLLAPFPPPPFLFLCCSSLLSNTWAGTPWGKYDDKDARTESLAEEGVKHVARHVAHAKHVMHKAKSASSRAYAEATHVADAEVLSCCTRRGKPSWLNEFDAATFHGTEVRTHVGLVTSQQGPGHDGSDHVPGGGSRPWRAAVTTSQGHVVTAVTSQGHVMTVITSQGHVGMLTQRGGAAAEGCGRGGEHGAEGDLLGG
eukprot:2878444-Rhodomonas_salina.1